MALDDIEGTWGEYRRLVLKEIESLHRETEKLRDATDKLEAMVNRLEVRVGLMALGIGTVASIIVTWLLNNVKLG